MGPSQGCGCDRHALAVSVWTVQLHELRYPLPSRQHRNSCWGPQAIRAPEVSVGLDLG